MFRAQYAAYSRDQLIGVKHQFVSHSAQHIAAIQLLEQLNEKEENSRHNKIHGKLETIDERLVAVEAQAKRPEYKTFALWIAIAALIIALAAWIFPVAPSEQKADKPVVSVPAPAKELPKPAPQTASAPALTPQPEKPQAASTPTTPPKPMPAESKPKAEEKKP